MTTDTRPKTAFREIDGMRIFGMCKGAGMIHPNMATMLAAIVTDATIKPTLLAGIWPGCGRQLQLHQHRRRMSTNDTVLLLANGAAAGARTGSSKLEA